jgi:1,2-diacylglycerol 3-alpha-glucosyltransferase
MFIIANSFTFNGGSTFVIRLAREYARRDKRIGVLVLVNKIEPNLKSQLEKVADIYLLKDYIRKPFKWTDKSQLGIFSPIMFARLQEIIGNYGGHIHVMGIFGLLFAARLAKKSGNQYSVSAGIYHQYEYMFDSSSLLALYAQRLFKSLGSGGAVFLNEANKKSYSKFFDVDYSEAPLVPVGIEIPQKTGVGDAESYRIVSVGNLYPFKTYNLHVIKLMPELLKINEKFTYEIYGEGELESEADSLIQQLGLEGKVFLKGRIPYSQFSEVLNGAFLFVGSGTAIVEAAALGIPSIVGIESSQEAVTFGYLSDIPGFSYNEFNESQKVVQMSETIEKIALDATLWEKVSEGCRNKAGQFSITHTVDGFEKIEGGKPYLGNSEVGQYEGLKLCFSFLLLGLKQFFRLDNSFSQRRHRVMES